MPAAKKTSPLSPGQQQKLLAALQARFEKNMTRHKGMKWADVQARLEKYSDKLTILQAMEDSGGEPDVIARDKKSGAFTFFDCAAESPQGRRSLCYDRAALNARKKNKPNGSAEDMATAIGIVLLDEGEYRMLQTICPCDEKTSSWIKTPAAIRALDGALFCDRRYGTVFTYHNGAQSYYAARGFRGKVTI